MRKTCVIIDEHQGGISGVGVAMAEELAVTGGHQLPALGGGVRCSPRLRVERRAKGVQPKRGLQVGPFLQEIVSIEVSGDVAYRGCDGKKATEEDGAKHDGLAENTG